MLKQPCISYFPLLLWPNTWQKQLERGLIWAYNSGKIFSHCGRNMTVRPAPICGDHIGWLARISGEQKAEGLGRTDWKLYTSTFISTDLHPPRSPWQRFYNFQKQRLPLGTKYSNTWDHGGCFLFKPKQTSMFPKMVLKKCGSARLLATTRKLHK